MAQESSMEAMSIYTHYVKWITKGNDFYEGTITKDDLLVVWKNNEQIGVGPIETKADPYDHIQELLRRFLEIIKERS